MPQQRRCTAKFKTHIVLDLLTGAKTMAQICRDHHLKDQVVRRWKADFLGCAETLFSADADRQQQRALAAHIPVIRHSDQGIQYALPQYVQGLRAAGVPISMASVGEPRQNGNAGRVIRTIKEDAIDVADYRDFDSGPNLRQR